MICAAAVEFNEDRPLNSGYPINTKYRVDQGAFHPPRAFPFNKILV